MIKKVILPLVIAALCFTIGCGLSNDGWSGNLNQTIGVTGTYTVVAQSGCQVYQSFTFTQIENIVEAVDNLGNRYDGWATQDLVTMENDPNGKEGDGVIYYYRTISLSISGTLRTGQTVTMILTPLYRAGDDVFSSAGVSSDDLIPIPNILQGTFTDDTGCSGYIEMQKLYTSV